jgi:amyloid beta precursor protein binding protein 1
LIHQTPSFFDPFTLILASNLHESDLAKLASICETNNKILISVTSKGLCGTFRIQTHQHTIIETHPENASDLRLAQPFQQLVDFVNTFGDLESLDQTDHAHVPFIVVLLIFVEKWKSKVTYLTQVIANEYDD